MTFFQRSGLQRDALAKVWAAADYSRRGFLDLPAFAKAMELISVAQRTGKVGGEAYTQAKAMGVAPPRMAGLEKKAVPGSHTERGGVNPFGGAESSVSWSGRVRGCEDFLSCLGDVEGPWLGCRLLCRRRLLSCTRFPVSAPTLTMPGEHPTSGFVAPRGCPALQAGFPTASRGEQSSQHRPDNVTPASVAATAGDDHQGGGGHL